MAGSTSLYASEAVTRPAGGDNRVASRFFITLIVSLGIVLPFTFYYGQITAWLQAQIGETPFPVETALMGPYVFLTFFSAAYLLGKTCQACGHGFWIGFLLGFIPPLWPAALARAAGRYFWLPYAYLALDAAIIAGAIRASVLHVTIFPIILCVVIPFAIYHLFGLALARAGEEMGYDPLAVLIWFCGVPFVVAFVGAIEMGVTVSAIDVALNAEQPLAIAPELLASVLSAPILLVCSIVFALLTWALWVRGIYKQLQAR